MLRFLSGISKSSSMCILLPKPLQSGHAPNGELNEKLRGSSSSKLKSHSGQA